MRRDSKKECGHRNQSRIAAALPWQSVFGVYFIPDDQKLIYTKHQLKKEITKNVRARSYIFLLVLKFDEKIKKGLINEYFPRFYTKMSALDTATSLAPHPPTPYDFFKSLNRLMVV